MAPPPVPKKPPSNKMGGKGELYENMLMPLDDMKYGPEFKLATVLIRAGLGLGLGLELELGLGLGPGPGPGLGLALGLGVEFKLATVLIGARTRVKSRA